MLYLSLIHIFAKLFDYKDGWGHITHDGSMANLEGLWYARQFKSMPLAFKEVVPDKVKGLSDWELLNMSVEKVLKTVSYTHLPRPTPDYLQTGRRR